LINDSLSGQSNKYESAKTAELNKGLKIEKDRGMQEPWEGWSLE